MAKLAWRKNPYTGDWESRDGRWEISPLYEPSLRGGSVTRPSRWMAKDKTGGKDPFTWHYLRDAKDYCARN